MPIHHHNNPHDEHTYIHNSEIDVAYVHVAYFHHEDDDDHDSRDLPRALPSRRRFCDLRRTATLGRAARDGGPREALRGGPHPCPGPVLAVWRLLGRGCHVQERCGHR